MHANCNLSKPHHYTLEEAMRWKLTLGMPVKRLIQHISPIIPIYRPAILPELPVSTETHISQRLEGNSDYSIA